MAGSIDRPGGFNIDAIDLTIDEEGENDDDDDDGGATESEASQDTIHLATPQHSARPFDIMNSYYQRQKPIEMPEKSPTSDDSGWKSASSSDAKSSRLRCSSNVNGSTPANPSGSSGGRFSKNKGKQQHHEHSSPPLVHPTGPSRTITKLRQLVRSCVKRHHVSAALFYADKLASGIDVSVHLRVVLGA